MGVDFEAVVPSLLEAASKLDTQPRSPGFQRGFFAKLVPNVRKLGLLDANNGYLRAEVGRGRPARVRVRRRHRQPTTRPTTRSPGTEPRLGELTAAGARSDA